MSLYDVMVKEFKKVPAVRQKEEEEIKHRNITFFLHHVDSSHDPAAPGPDPL